MPRPIFIWYFFPVCIFVAAQKDCGQYPVPQQVLGKRIVGGVETAENEVPWIASIQSDGVHRCGGSLIGTQYILTAAHCVTGVSPKDVTVVLGDWNRTAVNFHRKELSVDKIFVHELYKARRLSMNDLALIKTKDTVQLNERIWPICLQRGGVISEKSATESGWGKTSDVLMKVDLSLYNNDKCDQIAIKSQQYSFQTRGTHICAGTVKGRIDAYQGHSGGPLFISDSSGNGTPKWTLIGVLSTGFGFENEGTLWLFTRVSEFIEWIEENISESFESIDDISILPDF